MLRSQCIAMWVEEVQWRWRWQWWRNCKLLLLLSLSCKCTKLLANCQLPGRDAKMLGKNTLKTFMSLLMRVAKREYGYCPQKNDISLGMTGIQEILGTLQRRRKRSELPASQLHCNLPNNCFVPFAPLLLASQLHLGQLQPRSETIASSTFVMHLGRWKQPNNFKIETNAILDNWDRQLAKGGVWARSLLTCQQPPVWGWDGSVGGVRLPSSSSSTSIYQHHRWVGGAEKDLSESIVVINDRFKRIPKI